MIIFHPQSVCDALCFNKALHIFVERRGSVGHRLPDSSLGDILPPPNTRRGHPKEAAHNGAPVRRILRDGSEELEVCAEELAPVSPGVDECLRCPRRREPAHRMDVLKGGSRNVGA